MIEDQEIATELERNNIFRRSSSGDLYIILNGKYYHVPDENLRRRIKGEKIIQVLIFLLLFYSMFYFIPLLPPGLNADHVGISIIMGLLGLYLLGNRYIARDLRPLHKKKRSLNIVARTHQLARDYNPSFFLIVSGLALIFSLMFGYDALQNHQKYQVSLTESADEILSGVPMEDSELSQEIHERLERNLERKQSKLKSSRNFDIGAMLFSIFMTGWTLSMAAIARRQIEA